MSAAPAASGVVASNAARRYGAPPYHAASYPIAAPGESRRAPPEVAAVTDQPGARAYGVTLLDAGTGRHYEARGVRIRIGRGHECEVQPGDAPESVVSRIHAELTVVPSGGLVVRDAGSKNGTFLNDEPVTTAVPVRLGDRITLGRGGPTLIVEGLGTAPEMPVARRPGDSRRKVGWLLAILLALVLLLAGAVYGVYRLLSARTQGTERDQRTVEVVTPTPWAAAVRRG